jgi:nucleoid-associated protein YgaU
MGVAAKLTLIVAMVAIVLGAQLLEREIAVRRAPALAAAKKAGKSAFADDPRRPPVDALTAPLEDVALPDVPAGPPGAAFAFGTPSGEQPANADGERLYVVQQGDTLGKIAKKTLGRETAWQLIYQRNKAEIPDVARLKVGATLHIPAPDDRATTRAKRHPEPPRKLTMAPRAR